MKQKSDNRILTPRILAKKGCPFLFGSSRLFEKTRTDKVNLLVRYVLLFCWFLCNPRESLVFSCVGMKTRASTKTVLYPKIGCFFLL